MNDPRQDWMDDAAIGEIRREMVKFAHLQLRDAAPAEDAVQEALVARWPTPAISPGVRR